MKPRGRTALKSVHCPPCGVVFCLRDNRLVAFGVVSIAKPIAHCLNLVTLQLDRAKVG